jgi:uncharacterized membrane protein
MTALDFAMLGIISVVAIVTIGWFIYDAREDNEK